VAIRESPYLSWDEAVTFVQWWRRADAQRLFSSPAWSTAEKNFNPSLVQGQIFD
jgi:hypothetical protein